MKTVIPFTKEISLESKVAEITSISLEYEMHIDGDNLTGNFIVGGEYRAHEVSINTEPFTFRLPFDVELGANVDKNTVNFEIMDFNYELLEKSKLLVNIEFGIDANEITIESAINEEREEIEMETETIQEEVKFEDVEVPEVLEMIEERLDDESENTILNTVSEEDEFMTYHIHIVKENETLDSICTKYNVEVDFIKEYNELDEIVIGDKILIPDEQN